MTPFKAIYQAADRANAALINGNHEEHKLYSAETSRLIQQRLSEICAEHRSVEDSYPVVQFERRPDEGLL